MNQIIGPTFIKDTINSIRFISNILETFFQKLTDKERQAVWFQQDGATTATAHTARVRSVCTGWNMCKMCLVLTSFLVVCGLHNYQIPDFYL